MRRRSHAKNARGRPRDLVFAFAARARCTPLAAIGLTWYSLSVPAGTIPLISVADEITVGRQADAQVRRETPELRDTESVRYIRDLGRRLVRVASGPKYPYQFAARMAAGLGANVWLMKFSREDEAEADRVGLQILTRAGWEGRGMVELFRALDRESARNPRHVETWLSSHPPPRDRIAALEKQASRRSGRPNSAEFQRVKARLLKMPAPPR